MTVSKIIYEHLTLVDFFPGSKRTSRPQGPPTTATKCLWPLCLSVTPAKKNPILYYWSPSRSMTKSSSRENQKPFFSLLLNHPPWHRVGILHILAGIRAVEASASPLSNPNKLLEKICILFQCFYEYH